MYSSRYRIDRNHDSNLEPKFRNKDNRRLCLTQYFIQHICYLELEWLFLICQLDEVSKLAPTTELVLLVLRQGWHSVEKNFIQEFIQVSRKQEKNSWKFTTGVIALNFTNQFPGEMLDDHLCPTKFQLLLSMEFGCSVPRDRMDRIKICCIGLASLAKNNCFEEIRGRGLQDWELFDWVAPKE